LPALVEQVPQDAAFPSKLKPLFQAFRYKILYGGRGGSKSWGAARALLTIGASRPIRVLCAREVMHTIKESVHQLLKDQIENLGLGDFYDVTEGAIRGANGTQFSFTGLRSLTAANIKSFEGVDFCWVEEGQAVSKRSWGVLIPTIRKEGSEIWVTFNPELDTDDTWTRFVVTVPPESIVIDINWRDNPWFTRILNMERLHSKRTEDRETYEHIWEGKPRTVLAGAIYAKQVLSMVKGHRFRPVPYDPRLPVHTIWDMGWNDQNTVICVQKLRNEVMIIDYLEASFLGLSDWVKVLDKLPYAWGTDWLPWDGNITSRQTKKTDKQILKLLGRKTVKHLPKQSNAAKLRITSSRSMFPRVYMDNTPGDAYEVGEIEVIRGAGRLMECMKRYRRNVPSTTDEPTTPLHDEFSHGADAFGLLAMVVDKIKNEMQAPILQYEQHEQSVKGVM
jgi:phage terminase large subunit